MSMYLRNSLKIIHRLNSHDITVNILLVTRRYPPFGGGAENQFHRLAEALSQNGHSVTVLTGRHQNDLPVYELKDGVSVYRIFDPKIRLIGSFFFLLSLSCKMLSLTQTYDFVFTSMINETSSITALIAKILGKKYCLYPSAVGDVGNVTWATKHWCGIIFLWAARKADAIICQSEHFFPELKILGIDDNDMKVVKNTISRSFLEIGSKRQNKNELSQPVRVLWCGRLAEEKDPFILLDICNVLQELSINVIIEIAGGGGALTESFKDAIDNAPSIAKMIRFHENPKDVLPFFASAEIFLLTSRVDAMPLVIIEAMASGIPVIATDVGGIPTMIENRVNGILVPSGNATEMALAIKTLIESPTLRESLISNAHDYILKHHHPDQIAKEYELIFEGL